MAMFVLSMVIRFRGGVKSFYYFTGQVPKCVPGSLIPGEVFFMFSYLAQEGDTKDSAISLERDASLGPWGQIKLYFPDFTSFGTKQAV